METPRNKLYLFQDELHTAEGLIQIALEIGLAHKSIAHPANFDALLDHFYEAKEIVLEMDPKVYCGADEQGKGIYKLIALIHPDQLL